MYDQGVALNMVLLLRREPGAFRPEQFPEVVWMSNLFGRATHNLVLSEQLKGAYEADRKSTRLNSSHLVISYAVFCLKKNIQTSSLIWPRAKSSQSSTTCAKRT